MPSGYLVNGVDLDDLLEPKLAGDGTAAATGHLINGADMNTRYAPASVGTAYAGTTNFKQNGAEVATRFAGKGTRSGIVSPMTVPGTIDAYAINSSGPLTASAILYINPDGTWSAASTGDATQNGNWFSPTTAGAGSNWQVRFTPTKISTSAGTLSNGAATFTPINGTVSISVSQTRSTQGAGLQVEYSVLVEIQPLGGGAVVASSTVSMLAQAEIS